MRLNTAPVLEIEQDIDLLVSPVIRETADDARWDEEDDLDEIDWALMGLRRQIKEQGSLKVMH